MRRFSFLLLGLLLISFWTFSQDVQDKKVKYRRSALHTILVETESFPNIELVTKAYNGAPFPDQYDNHTLANFKKLDPKLFPITDADRKAAGTEKTAAGQVLACDTTSVKVVTLTGAGRFFCAGGDLKAMAAAVRIASCPAPLIWKKT